jgi:hypothetical protein
VLAVRVDHDIEVTYDAFGIFSAISIELGWQRQYYEERFSRTPNAS